MNARVRTALVAMSLACLATACGQRGPLYLPKDAAAKNRATLPDLMTPRMPGAASAETSDAASPIAPLTPIAPLAPLAPGPDVQPAPGLGR